MPQDFRHKEPGTSLFISPPLKYTAYIQLKFLNPTKPINAKDSYV